MTREEAIKDIQDNILPIVGGKSLRMAIEALQQSDHIADAGKKGDHLREVTKKVDTISRQAAKLKVARVIWEDGDSCYDFHDKCVDCLDDVPSVQPKSCEYYALCRHGRDEKKLRERLGFCEYCNEDSDGYVKPIEKNNHAFVRFGMNGWELSLKANGWHGSAKIRYCPMCGRDLYVK